MTKPIFNFTITNALYQGNATKLLNKLSRMDSFQKATGSSISPKHMKDKYIILRALSFYLLLHDKMLDKNNKKLEYRSDMEELLGAGMNLFNSMEADRLRQIEQMFDNTMNKAYVCLGSDGFRIPSNGKVRRPISMTLFETLFYYFTLFEDDFHPILAKKGVSELLKDEEYLRSLQHSVDSSVNVKIRFEKVWGKYREISDVRES